MRVETGSRLHESRPLRLNLSLRRLRSRNDTEYLLSSPEMAARLTGLTIALIALLALVWAGLHLVVGRQLRKLRPSARLMALGLAIGNMILLPFGTALGAYSLWVLLKDDGRRLFET